MSRIKFLGFSFIVAIMLAGINSCGVPSPVTPEVTAVEPASGSTIASTDAIIVTFSAPMIPGTLRLTGDMVGESDRGVWFQNNSTNDTLVIRPNAANGGIWSAGQHNLTIDVEATSGVAVQSLTLNYEIVATVPTVAVLSPENSSTIIGSTPIVIVFSVAMDPLTLVLSGDMAAVSDDGVWSTTLNENDTLVISSSSAWSNATENLIIDVDSAEGASLATLSLFYTVNVDVPVVESEIPADTSVIQGSTPIVVTFSLGMKTSTLNLSGSMADENPDVLWTSTTKAFDTLTITPSSAWSDGSHTVSIDAVAFNGFVLPTKNLSYEVDATLAVPAETPARNSLITSGESIIIDFGEEMDIGTLAASGSLWDDGNGVAWSATNSILTIGPATLWSAGPITLILDIVDLVGNSIATLTLDYTVDVITPTITAVMPVSPSILYNVNAVASADVVVISFSEQMARTSLMLSGDMAAESDDLVWSKTTVDDDTLTIGALSGWNTGMNQSLDVVAAEDMAGNTIVALPLELVYTVVADQCNDGIQNQDETDIDCGGSICLATCSAGDSCVGNADCSSSICESLICLADADSDGFHAGVDCNDMDDTVFPGATETCNSVDDDCNSLIDDAATDALTWYNDVDVDSYGNSADSVEACLVPAGYIADNTDCDDTDGAVNPGATETCNDVDDDCDALIDEAGATGEMTWYDDVDMDNYGDAMTATLACTMPEGFTEDGADCDDSDGAVNPGAIEICNGVDDDCDALIDEGLDYVDSCTLFTCAVSGSFDASNVADGTLCDDGDIGTLNDICTIGICAGTPP